MKSINTFEKEEKTEKEEREEILEYLDITRYLLVQTGQDGAGPPE